MVVVISGVFVLVSLAIDTQVLEILLGLEGMDIHL
jgi:hypothetical protein